MNEFVKAVRIRPGGNAEPIELRQKDAISDASKLMDNAYIQLVVVEDKFIILADEDGLRKELPLNTGAMQIVYAATGQVHGLVGPVVIVGPLGGNNNDPHFTDFTIGD